MAFEAGAAESGKDGGDRAPPPEPGLALAQGRARAGFINRRGSRIYSTHTSRAIFLLL